MKQFDDLVYGHKTAKKALQVLVKRSQERYYNKIVKGLEYAKEPLKCLLIGESGTGKTHLVNSLKSITNFPLLKLDATHFTPTGSTEGINSKQLRELIFKTAKSYLNQPEYFSLEGVLNQMVIFVDEFDKLGTSFESSGNWNKHVQSNFLTLIDNKEEFSGVSWIFAGAFSSLYETRVSKSIGFFGQESEGKTELSDKNILKAGIIPEMLGRISLIVELDRFTEEDYRTILVERLLPNYAHLKNIDVNSIVKGAYESGQGIRSLKRQLEMLSIDQEYETLTCGNI